MRERQKRHATPMKKEKRWQFKWVVRVRWSLEDNSLHLNYCAWCFVVFLESACRATNTSTCECKHTRWRLGRRIAHTHELFVYVIQCKIIQKHAFRWPLVLVIYYAVFIFFLLIIFWKKERKNHCTLFFFIPRLHYNAVDYKLRRRSLVISMAQTHTHTNTVVLDRIMNDAIGR